MGEQPFGHERLEALTEARLLTEVDHLLAHSQPDGSFDTAAQEDVATNLYTAVQEIAMPYAVTTTFQRAAEALDGEGRARRVFTWLGKCAITVAESGKNFHFSEAAYERVDVEIAEAHHSQERLRPTIAQAFISPKMSRYDASADVAKQEHLHDDDAVRVAYAVTDSYGNMLGRRLESLLVRDVPLASWIAMLKDPNNIFGKAFNIRDERSALSVMEIFEQLELPESELPEGPVTLVSAVLPYIKGADTQESVEAQLGRFRKDQELYKTKAEEKSLEWLGFEKALAVSLQEGAANSDIKAFIITLQHEWGEDDLRIITNHETKNGDYVMTRQLAALLEKAKQNLLNGIAAIQTGNDKVLSQMDAATAVKLQDHAEFIEILRVNGASPAELNQQMAMLNRSVARQNLKVSGGCAGDNKGNFRDDDTLPDKNTTQNSGEDKSHWKWKKGVCRVPSCPSPKPTEVGPCSVCRNCQHEFDAGKDPTKAAVPTSAGAEATANATDHVDKFLRSFSEKFNAKLEVKQAAGKLALVAAWAANYSLR